ncbi:hypothetical protein HPB52_023403 [Rhipicephalus sanguineus]|uniref:Uncharacterized protein n=1 Tax=Rhipicephalus sanguineus TaxID=34632 RepID=A0A9D4PFD5_RHISA|nr:hypothetical protein HPB52_023403 [Rhipicephalus sanguineus]
MALRDEVFTAIGSNTECLRELIRCVVREELQKAAAPPLPTVSSIASIIKDELHQALRDPVTLDNTTAVPTEYRRATYAEALKRPASSPPLFVHAPPTVSLQSAQQIHVHRLPFTASTEQSTGRTISGVPTFFVFPPTVCNAPATSHPRPMRQPLKGNRLNNVRVDFRGLPLFFNGSP